MKINSDISDEGIGVTFLHFSVRMIVVKGRFYTRNRVCVFLTNRGMCDQ